MIDSRMLLEPSDNPNTYPWRTWMFTPIWNLGDWIPGLHPTNACVVNNSHGDAMRRRGEFSRFHSQRYRQEVA